MKTNHPFKKFTHHLIWLMALLFIAPALAADAPTPAARNGIESLTHTKLESGKIVFKVGLRQPLQKQPVGFTINNPPRIVLDFPDTANGTGKSTYEVGDNDLRNMNIVQSGNRTRLVVNLTRLTEYETRIDGNSLIFTVNHPEAVKVSPGAPQRFAEPKLGEPTKQALRNVDFRRGSNGEGRIIVDLSDANSGIDIRNLGKNMVVDFFNATLPRSQERRLDVIDFGTPVQTVETYVQGSNVRMSIESKGLWEYSAYQADRQFIIDIKKVQGDPNKLVPSAKPGYSGEKLSLAFQNQDVRAILQVFTEFTGMNIVVSDSVTGTLTLRLKDVPWDQALDIILNARGLDKRKNGNVVWVAPRDELALKEKQELELKNDITNLEPLVTELFKLRYASASHVAAQIQGFSVVKEGDGNLEDKKQDKTATKAIGKTNTMLSEKGNINADDRTNTVYVKDNPRVLEEVRAFITAIDVPVRQVLIEARIVEASDNFAKTLGARLGFQDRGSNGLSLGGDNRVSLGGGLGTTGVNTSVLSSQSGGSTSQNNDLQNSKNVAFSSGAATISSATTSSNATTGNSSSGSTLSDTKGYSNDMLNVNLPSVGLGGNAPGILSMILFKSGASRFLNLELSALQADGKGKIISNPRVVAPNNSKATIEQGAEIACQTVSNQGTKTEWKKASLQLIVKPRITPDDNIILDLLVTKDAPVGTGCYRIQTKQISTQVLVENGGTAVIGGIYLQEEDEMVSKVPLLGDIPLLGNFFKNTTRSDNKTELLIFVTPKILNESLSIH